MRREITNNALWRIDNDLQDITQNNPGLAFLLATRIGSFYDQNKLLLNILHRRMHEIQLKYIVHDEKNKPQWAETAEGEPKKFLYLESVAGPDGKFLTADEVEKAYKEEANEFLNRSIKVEL